MKSIFIAASVLLAVTAAVLLFRYKSTTDVWYCTHVVANQQWLEDARIGECSLIFTRKNVIFRQSDDPNIAYVPSTDLEIHLIDLKTVYRLLTENDNSGRFIRAVPSFEKWWNAIPAQKH